MTSTSITASVVEQGAPSQNRARRGAAIVASLFAAGALTLGGASAASAATYVPEGEYDVVALTSGFDLQSYDHENEAWYASAGETFKVTDNLIPAEELAGYDTTGGGFRNAYSAATTFELTLVQAPSEDADVTITGDDSAYGWDLVDEFGSDSQTLPASFHGHFDWAFSEDGTYVIEVTATSGTHTDTQEYSFYVN
jgi:surface-anchored protein